MTPLNSPIKESLGIISSTVTFVTTDFCPFADEETYLDFSFSSVVDEVLTRRKEIEWFIEGDFDAYVERIRKPYVWGGELELLMASHLLK
ncbi:OTU domain-containing protein [Camellia lanceoleosa]|nr:OTU domain-containing protein [Camellia lanceoleosa]